MEMEHIIRPVQPMGFIVFFHLEMNFLVSRMVFQLKHSTSLWRMVIIGIMVIVGRMVIGI